MTIKEDKHTFQNCFVAFVTCHIRVHISRATLHFKKGIKSSQCHFLNIQKTYSYIRGTYRINEDMSRIRLVLLRQYCSRSPQTRFRHSISWVREPCLLMITNFSVSAIKSKPFDQGCATISTNIKWEQTYVTNDAISSSTSSNFTAPFNLANISFDIDWRDSAAIKLATLTNLCDKIIRYYFPKYLEFLAIRGKNSVHIFTVAV